MALLAVLHLSCHMLLGQLWFGPLNRGYLIDLGNTLAWGRGGGWFSRYWAASTRAYSGTEEQGRIRGQRGVRVLIETVPQTRGHTQAPRGSSGCRGGPGSALQLRPMQSTSCLTQPSILLACWGVSMRSVRRRVCRT